MNIQKVDDTFNLYQDLKRAIKDNSRLFLYIGLVLKRFRDEKLYQNLGDGGYDNFEDFINNAELGLRPPTAQLYIRIADYYHLQLGLTVDQIIEIPINRLMRILPILRKKPDEESKNIVLDVGVLTSTDFDKLIKEEKWEADRPIISKDKENGLYNISFKGNSVNKIYNEDTMELVWTKDA